LEQEIFIDIISKSLGIRYGSVKNTMKLFDEGSTIPFISRYRKELTGSLDEVQIGDIHKMYKKLVEMSERKTTILSSIEEQGKLTPELKTKIESSWDLHELEDLYLPYKKRKKTKADKARESGLEPLAKYIIAQKYTPIQNEAKKFVQGDISNVEEALEGACDIIAEWINEDNEIRDRIRNSFRRFAAIKSSVVTKKKEDAEKYKDYFVFSENLAKCPSHRFLAIMRGANEGFLKVGLDTDDDKAIQMIIRKYVRNDSESKKWVEIAILDSYKRLIFPSIETQVLNEYKEKADDEAIRVFVENLKQLLLEAPTGQIPILAIDPGFRTGCKVVCLDSQGEFLEYTTIFPHPPQNNSFDAKNIIKNLVDIYDIKAIAIGNGTASRETQTVVKEIHFDRKIEIYIVNESGASIYSASGTAREEFPDKDVTIRGAISIGRRLMDPLAELVKIDPKSIGVGQYQHDVHQGKLKENLDATVVQCVNKVGVNLNTASKHILTYISGFGPSLAKSIVEYRKKNGDFTTIDQLKKVPRLGEKAFEQSAGFLRIRNAKNPLDNTGVHPESYHIVNEMVRMSKADITSFLQDSSLRNKIELQNFVKDQIGLPTLQDIMKELDKPGLDPRGEAKAFEFDDHVKTMEDLSEGKILPGIVTNLTNFGAFVDIGVKQDGLVHISQITAKFIKSPADVLHLRQEVTVKVVSVDIARKRINLTMLI